MRRLRRAALGLAVASAVLAAVEGALRLSFPPLARASMPDAAIKAHIGTGAFRYDPELFWDWPSLPEPGAEINAQGFRRPEPTSVRKPEGTTRVVTLGDSQTFGVGLRPEATYSGVAERALGEGWEVLNAGVPGYRSLNVYRLLRGRVGAFSPDILVVDCMPFDSPRDTGADAELHGIRAALWRLRLYWVLRMVVERADSDRPRWLDQTRHGEALRRGQGYGNHDLIAAWAEARGITTVFMAYAAMSDQSALWCLSKADELPPGSLYFDTCAAMERSGVPPVQLFMDRNHHNLAGAKLVGEALAEFLRGLRGG